MLMLRRIATAGLTVVTMATPAVVHTLAQTGTTYTATATVKTAGGATATAPVTIVVSRTMSPDEAGKLTAAFTSGGAAALRKALAGVPPTGSIQIGSGAATPTRLALERTTGTGRLLTLVTDQPLLFLGAGVPGAKPTTGYDFAVLDLELDASGSGSGMLAPAAKIRVNDGAFVVEDYGGTEAVRLGGVKKVR